MVVVMVMMMMMMTTTTTMMMTTIMPMGWGYVSELRLPPVLLFIPHVIYEHGETWWNGIDRGKHSSTRALWKSHQQSHSSKAGETDEGNYWFYLAKYPFNTSKGFLICRKIYDMRHPVLLPLRKKASFGFYRPWPGFNPLTLGPVASTLIIRPPRTTKG
jgi:hypothetical protein